ncbi:UNVERIFIED_CONTAM: hypothetical protein Sradi_0456300 [Sesamum radiatum]|uniref:Uncharacterized protein n=1 Tax=Sesamum radiatum TaxID=300843 RepID=A0AAW2W6P0_SESRA
MKKSQQVTTTVVRRSGRLKSSVLRFGNQGAEPVVKHINLVENDKDEAPHSEQVNTLSVLRGKNTGGEPHSQKVTTVADSSERNLEDKVEYLILAVNELKLQVPGMPNEGSSPDSSYKSLYIESQKKIDALTEANYELVKNLEFVRGQVAALRAADDPKQKTSHCKEKSARVLIVLSGFVERQWLFSCLA